MGQLSRRKPSPSTKSKNKSTKTKWSRHSSTPSIRNSDIKSSNVKNKGSGSRRDGNGTKSKKSSKSNSRIIRNLKRTRMLKTIRRKIAVPIKIHPIKLKEIMVIGKTWRISARELKKRVQINNIERKITKISSRLTTKRKTISTNNPNIAKTMADIHKNRVAEMPIISRRGFRLRKAVAAVRVGTAVGISSSPMVAGITDKNH